MGLLLCTCLNLSRISKVHLSKHLGLSIDSMLRGCSDTDGGEELGH